MIRRYNSDILNKLKVIENYLVLWTFGKQLQDKIFRKCDFICLRGGCATYINCTFENCVFKIGGFKESVFKNCKFINCDFEWVGFIQTKFYNCVFENCRMENVLIEDSNLLSVPMVNTEIKNYFRSVGELMEKNAVKKLEEAIYSVSNTVPSEEFLEILRLIKDHFDKGGGGENVIFSNF